MEFRPVVNTPPASPSLHLHYQPIVAAVDGRLVAAEALLRASPGDRVAPHAYLSALEEDGGIVAVGNLLLERALATLASWPDAEDIGVAINVSIRQFESPEWPARVMEALARSSTRPSRLCLELTETALMRAPAMLARSAELLRLHGVTMAIDDFGTAYASMEMLKLVAPELIKIDRSFIAALPGYHRDRAVVRSIIHLAHELGIRVIAEGIERSDQWVCLVEMGCDLGQGFLFGRPCDERSFRKSFLAGRGGAHSSVLP
jgi:EAL domain-containing protein (putative c-di-GMP-specific phosphodiesterase class I)